MATSGSTDFTMTAGDVVTKAFQKLGIRTAETPLEPFEMQDGLDDLSTMLKTWQAQGLHLWTKTEGVIFLEASKAKYSLGPAGDHATRDDDFVGTTLTADAAIAATALTVASTANMAVADKIGIELDDGTRHWSTIATIPGATALTIDDGLASAATTGVSIYTYTNILNRPLRLYDYTRRKTYGANNEIEITKYSRKDYFSQVDKSSTGTISAFYYSPQIANGEIYVWQPPNTVTELLKFTYERPIEDADSIANNLDIPVEWLDTVIYNVAARLSDSYDAPPAKVQSILFKAAVLLEELLGWDDEANDLEIQPDFS